MGCWLCFQSVCQYRTKRYGSNILTVLRTGQRLGGGPSYGSSRSRTASLNPASIARRWKA